MLETLRHRLGHPVETTLALLEGKWRPGILDDLKERLLHQARIRKLIPGSAVASEAEQAPANRRVADERPSPQAGHVMQLYVVRHGIALDGGAGVPDEWRPLTAKGRRRFQKTARAFGNLGRRLDLILTSPLVRAVQTAEILAGETSHGEVAVLPELDPKFGVEELRNAIAVRAAGADALAIVGHEPQLSSVLAALSGVPQAEIDLDKGAIVRLDVSTLNDGAVADPRWWIKPKGTRKKGLPMRKEAAESVEEMGAEQARRASKKARRRQKAEESADLAEPKADVDESRHRS